MALAAFQYASVIGESYQAAAGVGSHVGPAPGIEHQVPRNGAAAPVFQRIGEDAAPPGPIPGVSWIVDERATLSPMERYVRIHPVQDAHLIGCSRIPVPCHPVHIPGQLLILE